MKHGNANIISDEASIIDEWTTYIKAILNYNKEMVVVGSETGLRILQSEVAAAVKNSLVRKVLGPNYVLADLLKVIVEGLRPSTA